MELELIRLFPCIVLHLHSLPYGLFGLRGESEVEKGGLCSRRSYYFHQVAHINSRLRRLFKDIELH